MAQRGRPRIHPLILPTDVENKVAEKLSSNCTTQGCKPKFHLEEAKEIVEIVRIEFEKGAIKS